ncbi:MAG: (2Fe-2S) ferredoxin domain-containing protein [Bacteroidales bacterium]|nr:(2Fe-2S) ferredoxin domain-containing protein [Bacteroidales bacterium]
MTKIKSVEALKKYQDELKKAGESLEELRDAGNLVGIKVAMATCSNAAGAGKVMEFISAALDKRGVDALVTKTGCMGYCYAEPTIEVTLPGKEPVVFGDVDIQRADQIIEQYIKKGETVEGVIPVNYKTVDEPYNE